MPGDNFWDRVNSILKRNRLTQSMAAAACGVKLKTFQSWIRKDYYPTVLGGHALAGFLGVTVEYLVTGKNCATKKQIEDVRLLLKEADQQLKFIRQ